MATASQKRWTAAFFAAMTSVAAADDAITIENFDDPIHTWTTMNDPVMGGQSSSSVEIEDGVAKFYGEVAVVPALNAPGFIQMITRRDALGQCPDVSSCTSLQLNIMATEPYTGYRVSFGNVHLPKGGHAYGYKADFTAPVGEFEKAIVPFTDFSAKWDEATGNTIVSCEENAEYCPDETTLQNMQTIAIWGEGVAGTVDLGVKSISAIGCSGESPASVLNESTAASEISIESASVSESTDKVLRAEKVPDAESMLILPTSKISLESLEDPSLASSASETTDKVLNAQNIANAEEVPGTVAENIALMPASEIFIEASESADKVLSEEKVPVANNMVLAPKSELPTESLDDPPLAASVSENTEKLSSAGQVSVTENIVLAPASEVFVKSLSNPSLKSSADESTEKVSSAENVLPAIESFENPNESSEKAPIVISAPESEISVEGFARNDDPENIAAVPAAEVSIVSSPVLTSMGNVASSDEKASDESMYAMARDNSSHSVTAVGGIVGFAAFLGLALLNRARSRGGAYIVVGGPMSAEEAV